MGWAWYSWRRGVPKSAIGRGREQQAAPTIRERRGGEATTAHAVALTVHLIEFTMKE